MPCPSRAIHHHPFDAPIIVPGSVYGAANSWPGPRRCSALPCPGSVHSLYAASRSTQSASAALAQPQHCKPDAFNPLSLARPTFAEGIYPTRDHHTPSTRTTTRHRHSFTPLRPVPCRRPLTPTPTPQYTKTSHAHVEPAPTHTLHDCQLSHPLDPPART